MWVVEGAAYNRLMIDKHFFRIVRELATWIVAVAVFMVFFGQCRQTQEGQVITGRQVIEFTPNRRSYWAWALVVAYLIYAIVRRLMHINSGWLNLDIAITLAGLAVMIAFPFPSAIHVTDGG